MSKKANIINLDVDCRVEAAIRNAMDIYINKLASGFIEVGLENTFQMHLADIIGRELDQNTFYDDERFMVKFEKNMPINGNKDYIDIVVEYKKGQQTNLYLIELKFKKVLDAALDLGNVESYKDIYNLNCHKQKTANVKGCYFIFLTNDEAYLRQSTSGTRAQIPMYDGYTIQKNIKYTVTALSAKQNMTKYPSGFDFSSNYLIEYQHMSMPNVNTKEKDYWFYILKI